ncbi:MAG: carboxypeptidase-like regulatory domain-containing protein, partial [Tannerellaceae bacterium]
MKKFNLVLFFMLMSIGWMIAQTKVSGIVISADDGEPIIGASVVVAGTTVGIVTDIDGKFTLEVPKNATQLKVTYVGMKPIEVGIKPNLRIVMHSDTKNLDEVVVLAMGMSKEKKSLGYAVQDVSAEQLTQASNTSLAGALQGKLSGVDIKASSGMPGASSQIVIRGARSFTGDNTPLYVVDGMPIASTADISTGNSVSGSDYANRAVDIDPNDIETINILKGQ